MSTDGVVIVGAGLAGATVVDQLRALGHDEPVTLVGAEEHLPYERPALSKEYLAGTWDLDRMLVHPAARFADQGVHLRLGVAATGLDVSRRQLWIGSERIGYDTLVIATGSSNIRPRIPGMDLVGVHQLRTVEDADALRRAAVAGAQVVMIGAGFIGCEVAATLRSAGVALTLVDARPGPLWDVLGAQLSERVQGWHDTHGVGLRMAAGVSAIEGAGSVERVLLSDGTVLPADVVVVAVGVRPTVQWLDGALGHVADGIAVDIDGHTPVADVYALGDLAAVDGKRTEHVSAARTQGARVAAAIIGAPAPAAETPWFWSDQYEHTLHLAGSPRPADVLVERPEPYVGSFLREGVLSALATIDNGRDFRRGMRLLGRRLDPVLLGDPSADLRTLT